VVAVDALGKATATMLSHSRSVALLPSLSAEDRKSNLERIAGHEALIEKEIGRYASTESGEEEKVLFERSQVLYGEYLKVTRAALEALKSGDEEELRLRAVMPVRHA